VKYVLTLTWRRRCEALSMRVIGSMDVGVIGAVQRSWRRHRWQQRPWVAPMTDRRLLSCAMFFAALAIMLVVGVCCVGG